jgi:hypothetical protein
MKEYKLFIIKQSVPYAYACGVEAHWYSDINTETAAKQKIEGEIKNNVKGIFVISEHNGSNNGDIIFTKENL